MAFFLGTNETKQQKEERRNEMKENFEKLFGKTHFSAIPTFNS